jgi:hypothetical protein
MAHQKSNDLLTIYEELMPRVSPDGTGRILEVGIASGESLPIWRKHFGTVFGLDITLAGVKQPYPHAHLFECDQHDLAALQRVATSIMTELGGPLDMIIDDGAHTGLATLNTWQAFWPILKPGGVYCIEDWGTGYWPYFSDGELVALPTVGKQGHAEPAPRERPKGKSTLPNVFYSHEYGMPGVVKQLLDELAGGDVYGRNGHEDATWHANITQMKIICGYVEMTKAWTAWPGHTTSGEQR